jgi:hypothetical protein
LGAALLICAAATPLRAQQGPMPSWVMPEILAAAKAEGELTVYSSTNEQEALPLLKLFQDVTGVKINYIRGAEAALTSRIMTETRAGQSSWDIVASTVVSRLPPQMTKQFDPPEAKNLRPEARDPDRRWYGVYAAYNAPAYNTALVKPADLPKTYEEFLQNKQWAGRVAMEHFDQRAVARLNALGDRARDGIAQAIHRTNACASVTGGGSMFRLHMKATVPANYREAYTNVDENRRLKMMLEHLFHEGFLMVGTCTGMLSTPMNESDIDALVGAIETGLKKIG